MNFYIEIAEQLIRRDKRPMAPREMAEVCAEEGLYPDNFSGKTPHKTFHARLSEEILGNGENSTFVRTAPGKFFLRSLLRSNDEERGLTIFQAPRRKPALPQEKVLVFPSSVIKGNLEFQGIKRTWNQYVDKIFVPDHAHYLDRMLAEEANHLKQVLTYILVQRNGQLLSFKRGQFNRVSEFLRGAICLGFGGHLTESDVTIFHHSLSGLIGNAARELREELRLPRVDLVRLDDCEGLQIVGVLNDDSSGIGQRHFAFVLKYQVSNNSYWDHPVGGEASVTQLRWVNLSNPQIDLHRFEYWSQLCLREFYKESLKLGPRYRILRKLVFKAPHVVLVVGKIGSGKSVVTEALLRSFGYKVINSGHLVASLINLSPIPDTPREVFQKHAQEFISEPDGPKRLARKILDEIYALKCDRIVVDGIRNVETYKYLGKMLKNRRLALLYVHTPPDLAYAFFRKREEPLSTIDQFYEMYNANVEREIGRLLNHADAVVYNWIGQGDLLAVLRAMVKELIK